MADDKVLDNEKLGEEQLEEVAGGTGKQIQADKNFLFQKGILRTPNATDAELKNAFAMYGIEPKLHHGYISDNKYILPNGQKVNQKQAWQFIEAHTRR